MVISKKAKSTKKAKVSDAIDGLMLRHIVANSAWNIVGLVLPLAAAVFAIPILVSNLGASGFGMLSLIWVLIGYFSLFDLGLGRAVTKLVSECADQDDKNNLQSLCTTSLFVSGSAGVIGSALVIGLFLVGDLATYVPQELQAEVCTVALWVGLCIPITVWTAVLRGVMEGMQRFRTLNLIRGPMGALFFLLPAMTSLIDSSLTMAVGMSVVARMIMLYAHYLPIKTVLVWKRQCISREWVKPLMGFGGWFTVSNIVGPIIVYMDRFVLSAVLPFASIGYYTAPFELVSKVISIPVAITSALFPVINKLRVSDCNSSLRMKIYSQRLIFAVMLMIVLLGVALSHKLLNIWLGADFADHSTLVMQWLLIGFGFNAMAQVTYVSLQSHGQMRVVAYLHLLELPLYGVMLWMFVNAYGMVGAAVAWAVRSLLDWFAQEYLLHKLVRQTLKSVAA